MSQPLVTVTVFNHNGKEHISKCLNSLLRQTYKNYKIVFFDDASADGSVELVKI